MEDQGTRGRFPPLSATVCQETLPIIRIRQPARLLEARLSSLKVNTSSGAFTLLITAGFQLTWVGIFSYVVCRYYQLVHYLPWLSGYVDTTCESGTAALGTVASTTFT